MIDRPRPEEKEKLVILAQETGFFSLDEIAIIREMLDGFFDPGPMDDQTFIVYRAVANAEPLGFACYGPTPMTEGTYDLYWIAVDKTHQNKKIGRALLEAMESELEKQNARAVYLDTSDTSEYSPTRAFYERMGYARAAHLLDFYKMGDGKVIYRKWLKK